MAEGKRTRRDKKTVLNEKIANAQEKIQGYQAKIDALNDEIAQYKDELADIDKAEKAAAKEAAKNELFKAVEASGLSIDEVRAKLGI